MSYAIQVNESNASRRVVYLWAIQSNGTSPATNEAGGRPTMSVGGLSMWTTANTLSAVSANAGHYALVLGTSDISLMGQGTVVYASGTALTTSVNVEIVGYDPFTPYSLFTSADSVGLKAITHSGATVAGLVSDVSIRDGAYSAVTLGGVTRVNSNVTLADGNYSAVTVRVNGGTVTSVTDPVTVGTNNDKTGYGLAAGSYSGVTIGGVERINSNVTIANADYSGVTVRVGGGTVESVTNPVTVGTNNDKTGYGLAAGTYSGVTVGVNNIAPTTYSGVTIDGVTRVNSSVTIADGIYSAVTVRTSNVTIATGGIVAASFGAGAIDAVALATDAGQEIADRVLQRNIMGGSDSGRTVSEALAALRNRVAIDGSVLTVYRENDTTAYWTASVATVSANSGLLNDVNPA